MKGRNREREIEIEGDEVVFLCREGKVREHGGEGCESAKVICILIVWQCTLRHPDTLPLGERDREREEREGEREIGESERE